MPPTIGALEVRMACHAKWCTEFDWVPFISSYAASARSGSDPEDFSHLAVAYGIQPAYNDVASCSVHFEFQSISEYVRFALEFNMNGTLSRAKRTERQARDRSREVQSDHPAVSPPRSP